MCYCISHLWPRLTLCNKQEALISNILIVHASVGWRGGSAHLGWAHSRIWWSSSCVDWTFGVTGLCPCVLSSNRLSQACFYGDCGGCKNASRDILFPQAYACIMSAKILSARESHMAGLGSEQEGTARLRGQKHRALMQPMNTACTCNKVTSQFIVKLIQATSLQRANI